MVEANKVHVADSVQDLECDSDGVETARQALASLDRDDEAYFEALADLADNLNLLHRFSVSRNPDDLDEGIARTKEVLDLAPPGHYFHLAALGNMGQALIQRFKFQGDPSDLTQAISCFEDAVELCTPEQSFYLPLVGNLASGLLNRYRSRRDVKDLDRIVETCTAALSASPKEAESPNRDSLLNNLASALKERFAIQGSRADLDAALTYYQSCLELRPPGHPLRHSVLGNLADAMLYRFEVDGHLQDLESAASYYTSALQLRSPGQDGYLLYMTSLGIVFWRLFNVQGDPEKVEMSIRCHETAMQHSTVPNLDHSRLLDNYGAALQSRYTLFGNISDLALAIQYLTTSSNILPVTYSGRRITLFNLGTSFITRFFATGNIADLDSSIENLASVVQLCGPGYHQRSVMLSVYGRALSARFNAKGDMQDLNLAASICKDALVGSRPQEVNYASTVANLTSTLLDYFYKSGNIEECQIIIDHCDRALVSTRQSDPAFILLKINRANAFLQKFQHGREKTNIDICIDAFREVAPSLPEGHAEYVPVHLQLAVALETRFKLTVDPKDMAESIAFFRIAHRHCVRGNAYYIPVLMQLGNALRESFEYEQDSGDDALDEAIVLLTEAEDVLAPTPGQSNYKPCLVNLGIALLVRFQAQRSSVDLDVAIERVSRALTLPASFEEFLISFTLATLLSERYTEQEDLKDLERSVELFSAAAEKMPPKHLVRANLCLRYGRALVKLGYHRDRLQHLDAAIVLYKEALEHLPPTHYDQPLTYMRLAEAQHERAKLVRDSDGVHDTIDLLRGVMQTLPKDSPMLYSVAHSAAKLCMSMYELSDLQAHHFMEEGFRYFETASHYTHTHSFMSVIAALEWVKDAEILHHSSALLAYQTVLGSLNRHLLATVSIKGRHTALLNKHWVKQTGTLATDAAACAISGGELELAVELLEQGRGLLWSQLSQSRTPLDALRSAGDAGRTLASEFERVSSQQAQSAVAQSELNPSASLTSSRLTMEEAARRYRQLSNKLDDVVSRIRQQAGFQSFLDRPSYESLKRAAEGGPVVLVNASSQRCDAVVVLYDAPPRLVPLPEATLEDLTALSAQLYHTLKTMTHVGDEKARERQVSIVLRTLWDTVVRPIVDDLSTFLPRGARIWWCPTSKLTSLPLHAAGPYRKGGLSLPSIYVSSYTPTLAALVRARQRPPSAPSSSPTKFVAIGQANPSGTTSPPLPTVTAELSLVRSLVAPTMPFSALSGDASTAEAALGALTTHAWVHVACHGRPDVERPFDASFEMRDRGVRVLELVRRGDDAAAAADTNSNANANANANANSNASSAAASAVDPEFAFLSACHTATSADALVPDELVNLAAAMHFAAGFRSVVGTMWAVDDGMAMEMVRAFYECMFSSSAPDIRRGYERAARALNRAAKVVDKSVVSIDQRIVFVHIGA